MRRPAERPRPPPLVPQGRPGPPGRAPRVDSRPHGALGRHVFPDWPKPHRVILYNDSNTAARQNSDIAHELAHGLLLHEPRQAIVNGCRAYDKAEEDEASWLAGCLLVPRQAAVRIAKSGQPESDAADEYGVSTEMLSWRLNAIGARRQAEAAARKSRSR